MDIDEMMNKFDALLDHLRRSAELANELGLISEWDSWERDRERLEVMRYALKRQHENWRGFYG